MRNLKKILALVLALVMSLSLMATASAGSFPDVDDDNPYATAIEVLDELKVFQGYKEDNTFRPTEDLNRAQAAVLVYRIATGDAEDKQVANYTEMANSKFVDLDGYNWAKGYINYCQNAGIVIGTDATHFAPGAKVTGYQLLVMLLRTLGYGQAGEFSNGRTWELQTAKIAEREGILKNITTGDLGSPAKRQMVAEILFRGLLTETVQYSVMTPDGYTKGETLGMREFKLEEIEGVVTGNEFADLNSAQVLDEGMTQIELADGTIKDLAITTEITDIGESRYAYITGTKVLATGDTGNNKVTEYGHASEIDTTSKFNAAAEMPAASDIEYYVNFDRVGTFNCDQRLEFNVVFYSQTAEDSFRGYTGEDVAVVAATEGGWTVEVTNAANFDTNITGIVGLNGDYDNVIAGRFPVRFTKIVRANEDITDEDMSILRGIFGAADNADNNLLNRDRITGDVFVGTMSTNSPTTNEERDLSNSISFNKFVEDYINDITYDINWDRSVNGQWVKFIDNDGDGQAEYAFRTHSWLDEALETYTSKAGASVTAFSWFDDDNDPRAVNGDYQVRYMNGEVPAVGDKVIAAWIDNQILIEPANDETVTVTDYNWRTDIINTDKGEYGQSGIGNNTDMQQFISTMDSKTEYIVYLDHFGYVRAYELPGGTKYTLITEIYANNNQNGNLAQQWPMTVELVDKDADAAEYNLNGGSRSPFVSASVWNEVASLRGGYTYYNWLQPATAHYGVTTNGFAPTLGTPAFGAGRYQFWDKNNQITKAITALNVTPPAVNDVFDYGKYVYNDTAWREDPTGVAGTSPVTVSFTNVAVTNINDDTATLTGAAQLRRDQAGNILARPDGDANGNGIWDNGDLARYAVDYVQLTTANTVKGQVRYPISDSYTGWQGNAGNNYVSATHDTEYYIVYNGGVYYFTDYVNMPVLNADNIIRAAYAVAHDTSADNASAPYWVADVIVYEVKNYVDTSKTSTALVYYNPSRNDNQVQLLNTLDSVNGLINAVPDPLTWSADANRNNFGPSYAGYGFYQFWDGEKGESGDLEVGSIVYIDGVDYRNTGTHGNADLRWNSNLIYAGTVVSEVEVAERGTYLHIDTNGDGNTNVSLLIKSSAESNVYSITTDREVGSRWNYNEANALRYNNVRTSEIKAGDRVVWIGGSAINVQGSNNSQTASFVVDLGNDLTNGDRANAELKWNTADFLLQQNRTNNTVAPISALSTGLWQQIMNEQGTTPAATGVRYDLNVVLGAWETAEVSVDGNKIDTVKCEHTGNAPVGKTVLARVPNTRPFQVTFKVSSTDGHTINFTGFSTADLNNGLALIDENADGTVKTYAVTISLTGSLLSLEDEVSSGSATVITEKGLTDTAAFINHADFNIGAEFNAATHTVTAAQAADIADVLTDVVADGYIPADSAYDTLRGSVTTASDKLDGEVLDAAKEAADTEVEAYLTDEEKLALSTTAQAAVTAAKAAYDAAVTDPADQAAIDAAVATYKAAVDAAKALDAAQTTAKADIDAYQPEGFADLAAETVTSAKETAEDAIDAAVVADYETAIPAAVAAYKQAIDDAIAGAPSADAVTVNIQGTNVTVAEDQAEIKKGDFAAVIKLKCPAGGELPADATSNKVQIRMVDGTLASGDWTYTRDAGKTTATITLGFSVAITGDITVGISATGVSLGSLSSLAVSDAGVITGTSATDSGELSYFVAAADADVSSLTQLNDLDDAKAILGNPLANITTNLTCADNGSKLYAVEVKDGRLIAIGASSSAISITKSTIAITGTGVTAPDAAGKVASNVITVDLTDGTDVDLEIAASSDPWDNTTDNTKWVCEFSFTLTAGFVAELKGTQTGVEFDPDTNTVTVTKDADPSSGTVTVTLTVKAPAAEE